MNFRLQFCFDVTGSIELMKSSIRLMQLWKRSVYVVTLQIMSRGLTTKKIFHNAD